MIPLAWCVAGPTHDTSDHDNIDPADVLPGCDNNRSSETTLEKSVERLWRLEKHGIESDDCKTMSAEDKRALNMLHNSKKFVDGQNEIGLLWEMKTKHYQATGLLLTNDLICFNQEPEFVRKYCKTMSDNERLCEVTTR